MDTLINKQISLMRQFQKRNNIVNQCVTNTQYLYDSLKRTFPFKNVKAKAVICVSTDSYDVRVITHMIVKCDNVIYEPSYDISTLKNVRYFENIQDFISAFNTFPSKKEIITLFIKFLVFEHRMNEGDLVITDKDFYNNQADYINIMKSKKYKNT